MWKTLPRLEIRNLTPSVWVSQGSLGKHPDLLNQIRAVDTDLMGIEWSWKRIKRSWIILMNLEHTMWRTILGRGLSRYPPGAVLIIKKSWGMIYLFPVSSRFPTMSPPRTHPNTDHGRWAIRERICPSTRGVFQHLMKGILLMIRVIWGWTLLIGWKIGPSARCHPIKHVRQMLLLRWSHCTIPTHPRRRRIGRCMIHGWINREVEWTRPLWRDWKTLSWSLGMRSRPGQEERSMVLNIGYQEVGPRSPSTNPDARDGPRRSGIKAT